MPELIVENLTKTFGGVTALDNVSFTVKDGEFFTLLGPSGCGKSTTLSSIAGLEDPDTGVIRVDDAVFFDAGSRRLVPTEQRNLGLVFQSYALWPHMTVADNLAFPLKLRKVSRSEQDERIHETLKLVELEQHKDRYPHQLSGGQQQRVALARALVYSPSVLLLDEPLSNLDAKLRERARTWLKQLQRDVGITTVYVTHDQTEALSLSDRVAVMRHGRIVQLAPPKDIYERPADQFVADFIGTSNFIRGTVVEPDTGGVRIQLESIGHSITLPADSSLKQPGTPVIVSVRPEKLSLLEDAGMGEDGQPRLPGIVLDRSYLGARYEYLVQLGGTAVRVESPNELRADKVWVAVPPDGCSVFPADRVDDETAEPALIGPPV